jgi:hypothetical protein
MAGYIGEASTPPLQSGVPAFSVAIIEEFLAKREAETMN